MTESQNRLIVLRFRDIELPTGETISRHKKTIAEHGFCWWGWLYRDYERNPHVELRRLANARGASSSFTLALFDTGRGKIFPAICQELRATSSPQRSPEPAATPDYYNDRRAPAWFQLTDIGEADASAVLGRVCVEMPSASDDCFVDLLGQSVKHLKDLRRQEVTLWVIG